MTEKEYQDLLNDLMKSFKKNKPEIPERLLNKSVDHITKTYAKGYKEVYEFLITHFIGDFSSTSNPSYQTMASLLLQIENRMNGLHLMIGQEIQGELQKNYLNAVAVHTLATKTVKDLTELMGYVPYSTINSFRTEQLIQDTMGDLLFATQHTSKELKKLTRDTFAKHLQLQGMTNENYTEIRKRIQRELSKEGFSKSIKEKGFVGIIDKSGRRWNLKTYTEMVVNTKFHQAYSEGLKDQALQTGNDLAKIPEKGASDTCRYFEGMIISLTGATEGYMTYDQLKATGLIFHPNCRHTPIPIGSIELLPDEDVAFHKEKVAGLKSIPKKKSKKV